MSPSSLLTVISEYPKIAYGLVFLISLSESLAFVGILIPGTVLMFGVGALIATGYLSLKPTLALAMVGAIAGDGISYWLGCHYHQRLRDMWPFRRHPVMLARGEIFFNRHGGKSVLLGRFVGPMRPVIPIVAGMLDMKPSRFIPVNILSGVGWAFAYVLPGVFFGTSLAVFRDISTRLVVLVILTAVTLWLAVALSRRLFFFLAVRGGRWLSSLEAWIASDAPSRGITRYLKRVLIIVFMPRRGEEYFIALLLTVALLMGWGFIGVVEDVLTKNPMVLADHAVYQLFQSLRTPWGDHLFVSITELGDGLIHIMVTGAVLAVLLARRCYRTAGYWLVTLVIAEVFTKLFKWSFHLPRPVSLYPGLSAFGFPSGHTIMNVVIYGFLAILLARGSRSVLRWVPLGAALLVSSLIGFSRLYLGAHWLSDVLGGLFLGWTWTALAGIAYLRGETEPVPRQLLSVITLVVFVTAGSLYVLDRHREDLAFYAPRPVVRVMDASAWIHGGWQELPARRIDIAGEREQPLTLQWAGSVDQLARRFRSEGWANPPQITVKSVLGMLSPDTRLEDLPVLPHQHDGLFEHLLLVRNEDGRRRVLRLWPTSIRLEAPRPPLWIGTLETQGRHRIAGLVTVAADTGDYMTSPTAFAPLGEGAVLRLAYRDRTDHDHPGFRVPLKWNGLVVLAMETSKSS